ncbi:ABC transporter substrate-binding protein [Beduini massiliensis]|uniref:ABC transporter substrate-binding protein n=1 Tax=Beduini massiliensis TaxID=1585974 RepID=UPI00059A7A76|nr:ABC transporter substrate-binding protein [Beduini massiliensis]
MKYKCIIGIVMVVVMSMVVYMTVKTPKEPANLIFSGERSKVKKQDEERKNTYVIGVSQLPSNTHPYLQQSDSTQIINQLVYPSLVHINKGNFEYLLADSILLKEQGTKALITIKKDLKFSDGSSLTAKDVLYSYYYLNHPDVNYEGKNTYLCIKGMKDYQSGKAQDISGIKELDEQTLEIQFAELNSNIFYCFELPILKEQNGAYPYSNNTQRHLGAGEYKIESLSLYDQVTLIKNEYNTTKTTYQKIKLVTADLLALNEQEIDTMVISKNSLDAIKQLGAYRIYEYSSRQRDFLMFNVNNDLMSEAENRRVIADALNTEEVVNAVYEDGSVSKGILSGDKEKPNYLSLKKKSENVLNQSVLFQHTYDGEGVGLFETLKSQLQDKVVLANRMVGLQTLSIDDSDIAFYHYSGIIEDVLNSFDLDGYFLQLNDCELKQNADLLEKYLTQETLCIPLHNESYYVIELNKKASVDIWNLMDAY